MIHLDVEQGSAEWFAAHIGRPSASQFHRLITAKKQEPAAGAESYANELLAGWLTGEYEDEALSQWVARGKADEGRAVAFYEALRDVDVMRCGFFLTDDERAGASPDGLVGDDGLVEVKVLSAANHVATIRQHRSSKPLERWAQFQGQLWIAERQWLDFIAWHPTIPPVVRRYGRDEEYIGKLATIVGDFCDLLDREKAQLAAEGYRT